MKEEYIYASYSRRFGAMLLDVLIFQILILMIKYWGGIGKWYYIVNSVAYIFWIYFVMIYLVKRTGASIGKLILGIVIVKVNGKPVNWKNAILRESIPVIKAGVNLIFILSIFQTIDNSYYLSLKPNMTQEYLHSYSPYFSHFYWIGGVLTTIEIVTVFTNRKRRSLHDFIAGTVVISKQKNFLTVRRVQL